MIDSRLHIKKMGGGFTLLELLLVIAILGIISAVAVPMSGSFLARSSRQVATDRIASEIYKAQNFAMNERVYSGSVIWGVCLTGNTFRMFNGSCASPNYREDYSLPSGLSLSGLSLVTFGNLRGEPSAATTITITNSLGSNTIVTNLAGMVEVN